MNFCSQHGSDIVFENKNCPACQEIKDLKLKIVVLEEELADYGRPACGGMYLD